MTYSYYGETVNQFSLVSNVKLEENPLGQIVGPCDVLAQLQDIRTEVVHFYILRFYRRFDYFKDKNVNIFPFTSGEEFFESNILSYDIVFLDIELPGINGVSIAKLLREKNYSKILIFTTNLAQYALKGYEVDALCFFG